MSLSGDTGGYQRDTIVENIWHLLPCLQLSQQIPKNNFEGNKVKFFIQSQHKKQNLCRRRVVEWSIRAPLLGKFILYTRWTCGRLKIKL